MKTAKDVGFGVDCSDGVVRACQGEAVWIVSYEGFFDEKRG